MTRHCQFVTAQHQRDALVISVVRPDVLDPDYIEDARGEIADLIAAEEDPRIVINLEGVHFLSSTAVSMLIQTEELTRERGGQLRVCGISEKISEVLRIVRLPEIVRICETTNEAIRSFTR